MRVLAVVRPVRVIAAAIVLAMVAAMAGLAAASPFVPETSFLPHRASYKMHMVAARDTRNISSVGGTITFEWANSCEAWTTSQKFALQYQYTEAEPETFTSDYSSWEAKDGRSFSFTSRQAAQNGGAELVRGNVERKGDQALVEYTRPEKSSITLSGNFSFPAQHTFEVMRRAAAGEKFFSTQMFDGSDAQGPVLVSAVILGKLPTLTPQEQPNPILQGTGYKLRMAFFDSATENKDAEPTDSAAPAYEMTLDLLENGVVRKIRIDYREFSIEGVVDTLDALPPSGC